MTKEIWKDIQGYEGLYQVSNLGRVKSLDRLVKDTLGRKRLFKGKILSPDQDKGGYKYISLTINRHSHTFKIHRLVAQAFIPNPNGYPQVNHKDENKANNYVNNLEWCTAQYNINYGTALKRAVKHRDYKASQNKIDWVKSQSKRIPKINKSVIRISIDGKNAKKYSSIKKAAQENNCDNSGISKCCKGKAKSEGGFLWIYAKDYSSSKVEEVVNSNKNKKDVSPRKVAQINIDTGKIIKLYSSVSQAAKELGVSRSGITNACCGATKNSHGYKWKYID